MPRKNLLCICLVVASFLTSCSRYSLEITQRKHRPGYYINISDAKRKLQKSDAERNTGPTVQATVPPGGEKIAPGLPLNNNAGLPVSQQPANESETPFSVNLTAKTNSTNAGSLADHHNAATPKAVQKIPDNSSFYWMNGIAGLLAGGSYFLSRKKLIRLTKWSRSNPGKSLFIQVAGNTAFTLGAFIAGSALYQHDIVAEGSSMGVFTSVFLGSALFHRLFGKNKFSTAAFYSKRLAGLATLLSGVMLSASLGNIVTAERLGKFPESILSVSQSKDLLYRLSAVSDREIFSPAEKNKVTAGQVVLIVLTVILSLVLTLLLLGLYSSIACNGNGALAILVLAAGLILLMVLSVAAINGIVKMNQKDEKSPG